MLVMTARAADVSEAQRMIQGCADILERINADRAEKGEPVSLDVAITLLLNAGAKLAMARVGDYRQKPETFLVTDTL